HRSGGHAPPSRRPDPPCSSKPSRTQERPPPDTSSHPASILWEGINGHRSGLSTVLAPSWQRPPRDSFPPYPDAPTIAAPPPRTSRPFSEKSSRQAAVRRPPPRQGGDPLPWPPDPTRHAPPTRSRRQSGGETGTHTLAPLPPCVPCFCDLPASSLAGTSEPGGKRYASRAESASRSVL